MSIFGRSYVKAEPFGVSRQIVGEHRSELTENFSGRLAIEAIKKYWTTVTSRGIESTLELGVYRSPFAHVPLPAISGRNVTLLYPSEVHSALVLPQEKEAIGRHGLARTGASNRTPEEPETQRGQYDAREQRILQRKLRKAIKGSEPVTDLTFPFHIVETARNSDGDVLFTLPFILPERDIDDQHAATASILEEERRRYLAALYEVRAPGESWILSQDHLKPAIVVGNLACSNFPQLEDHVGPLKHAIELALEPVASMTYEQQLETAQKLHPINLERPEIRSIL